MVSLVRKPPECRTCTLEIRDSLGQPAVFQLCFWFPYSASGEMGVIRKLPEEGKHGGGCCSAGARGGLTSRDVLLPPEQHTPDLLAFPVVSKDAHQLLTSMLSGSMLSGSMLSLYWELRNHFAVRPESSSPGITVRSWQNGNKDFVVSGALETWVWNSTGQCLMCS